ncbi:nitrogen fixation protein NifQ [Endothiovibrio diazotrophicus]
MKSRTSSTMRDTVYGRLIPQRAGRPNDEWLARMIDSWWGDEGVLPAWLGLDYGAFMAMLAHHFPGVVLPDAPLKESGDPERTPEREELVKLFLLHTAGEDAAAEGWMAEILAAGCMGGDHLWQDLGLWSRKDLSALIRGNFPTLFEKNDRDMKWKRFFYKQLCVQEGIYTCRAPSCEACAEYAVCFGPEE